MHGVAMKFNHEVEKDVLFFFFNLQYIAYLTSL